MKQNTDLQQLIGKEIDFDQSGASMAAGHLNRNVIPHVKSAIAAYTELQILKPFTADVFQEWVESNGESVRNEYMSLARKDAQKFKLPEMQAMALKHGEEATKYFIQAWRDAGSNLVFTNTLYHLSFGWEVIRINEDLQPVCDLDKIDPYFSLKIQNEKQAKLWEIGKRAESVLSELFQHMAENGANMNAILWTGESGKPGLFDYGSNGRLTFNKDAISLKGFR